MVGSIVRTCVKPARYSAGTLFSAPRVTAGRVHVEGLILPSAVASVSSFAFRRFAALSHDAAVMPLAYAPARSTHSTSVSDAHQSVIWLLRLALAPGIVEAITVVIGRAALMRVTAAL